MTLDTHIRIVEPINPLEVFRFCQGLLGDPEKQKWKPLEVKRPHDYYDRPGFANEPMQGLPAWLFVYCGQDGGPLPVGLCTNIEYPDDEEEPCGPDNLCFMCRKPQGYVEVSIDTAYGYKHPETGAGCGDLHAGFIDELGKWLEQQGLTWWWENEFTGEWHPMRENLHELGDGGRAATEWFRTVAAPAIFQDIKERSNGR